MEKRGQMKISFGMIFSIILIIVFIIFAFYGIKYFIELQKKTKVGKFYENLQSDIDSIWKGPQAEQTVSYALPNDIEKICFKDWRYENLVLEPKGAVEIAPINISHIAIGRITSRENGASSNTFCLENENEKVNMILSKSYGETAVMIKKA